MGRPIRHRLPAWHAWLGSLIGGLGLFGQALGLALIGLPMALGPSPAHAQTAGCALGGTTPNVTFELTAATLGEEQRSNWTAAYSCTSLPDSQTHAVCATLTPSNPTTGNTDDPILIGGIPVVFERSDGSTITWNTAEPVGSITAAVSSDVSLPIVLKSFSPPAAAQSGVHTLSLAAVLQIYSSASDCTGTMLDQQAVATTVMIDTPHYCAVASVPLLDFGTLSIVGTTIDDLSPASGDIRISCNGDTTYTIYLGDGGARQQLGSGLRQMQNGDARLPYQLHQESATGPIWDETGMAGGATGGSGGVTDVGDDAGGTQAHKVFAVIPGGTVIPPPGSYTDQIIVTVVY